MAKAIAIFTGGITELRQAAIRTDGVVFKRAQVRDPRYGYRWTSWTETGLTVDPNATELPSGFTTLRRATPNDCFINNRALFDAKGAIKVRLP